MDIEALLNLIENHGIAVVLLILIIVGISKFFDWSLPVLKKIIEKAIGADPANPYAAWFADNLITRSKAETLLSQLLDELDADRIAVFEYHNGGKAVAGFDYSKVSNSLEVVRSGIRRQMVDLQNLPVGFFARLNRHVVENKMVICPQIADLRCVDEGFHQFMTERKTRSVYTVGLFDLNSLPFGFILIEYSREIIDLPAEKVELIKDKGRVLSTLLTFGKEINGK